jgi:ABC-type dipeptide/oligopeptide/nickel transport system ATPase component
VAAYVSDQICVMYQGRIVERGDHHLMRAPQHPYTQRLATSAPSSLRLRD